ncbi:hypothetical protein [Chlamydia trachomatis]|nr:hypothetical protein [Chlamydia trachomatis]
MNTIMEGTDNLFASIRTLAPTLRHRATSLLLKTLLLPPLNEPDLL